jgi:hypothetical protein
MRQLLYVSNARRGFDQVELDSILMGARRNNVSHNVTGMLLYLDGAFMQVLEGQHEEVGSIYRRILEDVRHWGAQILLDRECARSFPNWSMGFERLGDGEGAFALDPERLATRIPPEAPLDVSTLVGTFLAINKNTNR